MCVETALQWADNCVVDLLKEVVGKWLRLSALWLWLLWLWLSLVAVTLVVVTLKVAVTLWSLWMLGADLPKQQ